MCVLNWIHSLNLNLFKYFRYVFLSTLDGKITALNIADGGRKAWELSTEPGALLSSNIDQVEVKNII